MLTTRHALEMKTVSTLKKIFVLPRKKQSITFNNTRATFYREMDKMGYADGGVIYRAWHDVIDIAELELEAA